MELSTWTHTSMLNFSKYDKLHFCGSYENAEWLHELKQGQTDHGNEVTDK